MLVTFDLERFEWTAPDRLQLAGTLSGLDNGEPVAPALVVHGAERSHRLQAVDGDGAHPPQDGEPWAATFAWQESPEPFETAELELARDVSIQLPAPRAGTRPFGGQRLQVRQASEPDEGRLNGSPPPAAERLRLQSELVSAQEEARELRARLERAEAELSRAREDLQAERERRAADSERFREGLASVQAYADEALADEQHRADELRAELEAAVAARREAEATAANTGEQLAAVEKTREENERLREARDQVQQVLEQGLERIVAVRDAQGDNG